MCAFYTFLAPAMAFGNEGNSDADWEKLIAGDVIFTSTRQEEPGGSVRIRILVQAPSVRIWNVISRCQYAFQYLAGMEQCEILLDEPDRALTRHVIDPGVFAPTLDYVFETLRDPYVRLDLSLVEGNLKQVDGYWRFENTEYGVLLEHESHVQARFPVPRWLIRRKLKKDMPRMVRCIRGLSGGSPDTEIENKDLAACQVPEFMSSQ